MKSKNSPIRIAIAKHLYAVKNKARVEQFTRRISRLTGPISQPK